MSGVKDISKALMVMELPVGANPEKKAVAMANLSNIMDQAHAVRCPGNDHLARAQPLIELEGPAALDITWVGAGAADCYFHFGELRI